MYHNLCGGYCDTMVWCDFIPVWQNDPLHPTGQAQVLVPTHVPPFRQIGLQTGPAGVVGGAVVTAAAVVVSVVIVAVCVVVVVGSWVGATAMVYGNTMVIIVSSTCF